MDAKFQKERHTLLIPDLFPVHMELLADAIRASGYQVEILRTQGAAVLEKGLRYIHNDMCYLSRSAECAAINISVQDESTTHTVGNSNLNDGKLIILVAYCIILSA